MTGNKNFGKQLKKLREAKGLSQEKLAELVGLEYQTISRIETGLYFTSFDNLDKISKALNISIKDLFNFSESNYTKKEIIDLINQDINSFKIDDLKNIYEIIKIYKSKIN